MYARRACHIIGEYLARTFRSRRTLSSASAILNRIGVFVARLTTLRIGRRVPLLLFALLAILLAIKVLRILPHIDGWAKSPTYTRVDFWIGSSECTVRSGTFLTYCMPDGKIVPIEDKSLADDRGHTLIANVYAFITDRPIDRRTLTLANVIINAVGLLSIAAALLAMGWPGAAVLVLLFGYRLVIPGPVASPDATAAYVGAFSFALAAVILIASVPMTSGASTPRRFFVVVMLATLALAAATLLRQPFGVGGFFVAAVLLGTRVVRERGGSPGRQMPRAAIIAAGLVLATFFSTHALIGARSVLYGIPRGEHIIQHGISHNLYIGLGVPGNPWGIKWSDQDGFDHASKLGSVRYASSRHYDNLLYLYMQTVLNDPLVVAKIYVDKLRDSLLIISDRNYRRLNRVAALLIILLAAHFFLRRQGASRENLLLSAVWGMFAIVLLQGVLALPLLIFLSPGPLSVACGLAVLIAAVTQRALSRLHNVTTSAR